MGQVNSPIATSAEVVVYLQSPKCCHSRCAFPVDRPAALSSAPPELWQHLAASVTPLAQRVRDERIIPYVCLVFLAVPNVYHAAFRSDDVGIAGAAIFSIAPYVAYLVCIVALMGVVVRANGTHDASVRAVVDAASPQWVPHGWSLSYRTQFTSFCRPKGAVPVRAIVFTPPGAPTVSQGVGGATLIHVGTAPAAAGAAAASAAPAGHGGAYPQGSPATGAYPVGPAVNVYQQGPATAGVQTAGQASGPGSAYAGGGPAGPGHYGAATGVAQAPNAAQELPPASAAYPAPYGAPGAGSAGGGALPAAYPTAQPRSGAAPML